MRVVQSHRIARVLAEWKRQYQAGEKPSEGALRRQLNAIRREQFPWMRLVPKSVPQQAIKNCGAGFERFFKQQGRYPKFKKKGYATRPAWTTVPAPSSLRASACACL